MESRRFFIAAALAIAVFLGMQFLFPQNSEQKKLPGKADSTAVHKTVAAGSTGTATVTAQDSAGMAVAPSTVQPTALPLPTTRSAALPVVSSWTCRARRARAHGTEILPRIQLRARAVMYEFSMRPDLTGSSRM